MTKNLNVSAKHLRRQIEAIEALEFEYKNHDDAFLIDGLLRFLNEIEKDLKLKKIVVLKP